jgi:molybdopterin converting factor small subunit
MTTEEGIKIKFRRLGKSDSVIILPHRAEGWSVDQALQHLKSSNESERSLSWNGYSFQVNTVLVDKDTSVNDGDCITMIAKIEGGMPMAPAGRA